VRQSFAEEITAGRVRLLRGCSWEQLALVPDGGLNWVYLDAAHDFDSVVRDLNAVLPKLRPGGIVAGHD
jgi:predicted O-methyltransferase YrrM